MNIATKNCAPQKLFMRQIGIAVHKTFWQIANIGLPTWEKILTVALEQQWNMQLLTEGVPHSQLTPCLEILQTAVTNTLENPKGRWILDSTHQWSKSEWALATVINGEVQQVIIDRVFVDDQGVYWIIDYKTCFNNAGNLIDPAYIKQLQLYKQIVQVLYPNVTIKTGLYFSLQREFKEINL